VGVYERNADFGVRISLGVRARKHTNVSIDRPGGASGDMRFIYKLGGHGLGARPVFIKASARRRKGEKLCARITKSSRVPSEGLNSPAFLECVLGLKGMHKSLHLAGVSHLKGVSEGSVCVQALLSAGVVRCQTCRWKGRCHHSLPAISQRRGSVSPAPECFLGLMFAALETLTA
jgi:hypothetical protein